jgi:hypothetical protein
MPAPPATLFDIEATSGQFRPEDTYFQDGKMGRVHSDDDIER